MTPVREMAATLIRNVQRESPNRILLEKFAYRGAS
jgi:hypothetical protein